MGKTAFSGPVYGAKSMLWGFNVATERSSGASTRLLENNATRTVPPYEDWYITEVAVSASTNSTVAAAHAVYLKTEGGSTTGILRPDGVSTKAATLASLVNAQGSSSWSTWATVTPTAGEYEGAWVPAGSSLRLVSSGVSPMAGVAVQVMGYIRYVNSTRSEG